MVHNLIRAYSYTHGLQDYVHAFVVEKCFKAEGTMHGIGEMVHNLKNIVAVFKIMYMHLWPPGSRGVHPLPAHSFEHAASTLL